jgi:hypothetical protein
LELGDRPHNHAGVVQRLLPAAEALHAARHAPPAAHLPFRRAGRGVRMLLHARLSQFHELLTQQMRYACMHEWQHVDVPHNKCSSTLQTAGRLCQAGC